MSARYCLIAACVGVLVALTLDRAISDPLLTIAGGALAAVGPIACYAEIIWRRQADSGSGTLGWIPPTAAQAGAADPLGLNPDQPGAPRPTRDHFADLYEDAA